MPRRIDIDWDEAGLGEVPDVVIAAEHDISTRRVQQERYKRGIEAPPREDSYGAHLGINWDKEPLGKVPDEVIAKKLLVDPRSVIDARVRRGIPSFSKQRRQRTQAGELELCMAQSLVLEEFPENGQELVELLTANGWAVIFKP